MGGEQRLQLADGGHGSEAVRRGVSAWARLHTGTHARAYGEGKGEKGVVVWWEYPRSNEVVCFCCVTIFTTIERRLPVG